MIYDWLIDPVTESAVQGLSNWLNDLWQKKNCPGTDQLMSGLTNKTDSAVLRLTNWLNDIWLVDWLTNWLYYPKTDQHTEWFIAGC